MTKPAGISTANKTYPLISICNLLQIIILLIMRKRGAASNVGKLFNHLLDGRRKAALNKKRIERATKNARCPCRAVEKRYLGEG